MVRIGQLAHDGKTLLYEINSDRLEDSPDLCQVLAEVRAEVIRREPPETWERKPNPDPKERRRTNRGGPDWSGLLREPRHHDLAERVRIASEAAEARASARPRLEVKPGDWVTVGGRRLLVARTIPDDRKVQLQMIDDETGFARASSWADGTGLESTPAGDELAGSEVDDGSSLTGYDEARHELDSLKSVLVRAGLRKD